MTLGADKKKTPKILEFLTGKEDLLYLSHLAGGWEWIVCILDRQLPFGEWVSWNTTVMNVEMGENMSSN